MSAMNGALGGVHTSSVNIVFQLQKTTITLKLSLPGLGIKNGNVDFFPSHFAPAYILVDSAVCCLASSQ
jgi:hypothetical protein